MMKRNRDSGSDAVDDIFLDCVLDEDDDLSQSSSSSHISIDEEEEEEEEEEEPTSSSMTEQSKKKEVEEVEEDDGDEKGGDMLFVPIQWTGFESRQRHSAMFNAPLLDAIQIDVWDAPCLLSVQRSLIQERKCGLFDPYLSSQDHKREKKRVKKTITIPISQQTLQDLFDSSLHTNQDWLTVWAYFGLLYGLCIESVTPNQVRPDGPVWIQTRHGFSILELTKLVQLCDFLQDHDTTRLLGQSLTRVLSKQTHTTTSLVPVHLMEVLLSHSKELGLEKNTSVFDMFYSTAIQSELKITTRFFVTALSSNFAISAERVRTMLRLLALREEQIYDSNSFGHYEPAQVDELAHCFIPLSQNVLNHLRNMYEVDTTRFEAEKLIHVTNRPTTNMRLFTSDLTRSIHNISGFWNNVFKDLPLNIAHHLFLSGSMMLHELLTFYTHNYRQRLDLFAEADMNVYVYGKYREANAAAVEHFLLTQFKHAYSLERETGKYYTVITVVLPSHPLLYQNSLYIEIIYQKKDVTPYEIVTHHHLCPVRAFYLPVQQEIMVAPSALLCWGTGYMTSYRVNQYDDVVYQMAILTYITRKFGVWMLQYGQDTNLFDSQRRLYEATKEVAALFPRLSKGNEQKKQPASDENNILLTLYPKQHIHVPKTGKIALTDCGKALLLDCEKMKVY